MGTLLSGMGRRFNLVKGMQPELKVLIMGQLFLQLGRITSVIFFALYLTKHTHLTLPFIGVVLSAGAIGIFGGSLFLSALSDRIGRKKTLFSFLVLSACIYTCFALTTNGVFLFILNALDGFSKAVSESITKAYLADFTEPERRREVYSVRFLMGSVGSLLGTTVAVYAGVAGGVLPFWVTAGIYVGYILILLKVLGKHDVVLGKNPVSTTQSVPITQSLRMMVKDAALLWLIMAGIAVFIVAAPIPDLLTLRLNSIRGGLAIFPVLMNVANIELILMQMPVNRWMEKKPPIVGCAIGVFLFCIGCIGFAISDNLVVSVLSIAVFTLGEAFVFPSEYVLIDRIAPAERRDAYYGAQYLEYCGGYLGVYVGTTVMSFMGATSMFMVFAGICFVAMIFYLLSHYVHSKRQALNNTLTPSTVA